MSPRDGSLYVLVMAGGRGTRFWPRSRRRRPKQVVPLGAERSLLRATIDRVLPLVAPERVLVVTSAEMVDAVRPEVADLPPENLLVEPEGRNTAPCIGWGATEVGRRARSPEAVLAVLPSDHMVADEEAFREVLATAAEAARATNGLLTIGVPPTRPETGFGYLQVAGEVGRWRGRAVLRVARFVEKPDPETAAAYLADGRYLWNAGMFVFTSEAIRDAFRQHLPASWEVLERIRHRPDQAPALYGGLERISIDYGIMERAANVLTVEGRFGWMDLGSWQAVGEILPPVDGGRGVVGEAVAVDSRNCIVHAPGRTVALVGVEDLVVVDAGDALLVCRRDADQRVREVIEELERRGREDLL